MSGLSRKVKRLQRKNSQSHIFLLFLFLLIVGGAALAARLYAVAPVKIMDSSMVPKFKEQSIHWMCKLPQCIADIRDNDIVWVALRSGETMVRSILALPGDSIEITDKSSVHTIHRTFRWKGENGFIQSRTIYIPKAGDTLYFDKLNDVEQDYVISYLHSRGEKVGVKSTLWQGDREINIDRVGSTKIANRQVSLNEINFLPWQDRYLIELQIRQSEPGNSPIKIKRKLFHLKPTKQQELPELDPPQDSTATDSSTKAKNDSTKIAKVDSMPPLPDDIFGEPINEIVIDKDCYFIACKKGESCPDSREMGFFTRDEIIGKYIATPDRIKMKLVTPIKRYADKALEYVLSLLFPEKKKESVEEK